MVQGRCLPRFQKLQALPQNGAEELGVKFEMDVIKNFWKSTLAILGTILIDVLGWLFIT